MAKIVKKVKNFRFVPPENTDKYHRLAKMYKTAPNVVKPLLRKAMDDLFTGVIPEAVIVDQDDDIDELGVL